MSTHTDTLRQVRRANPTMRGRALSPSGAPLGGPSKPSSMTQSFFARGEEQEATGYENLAPDDPLLMPPEVEFDSFDKIPRRRGSLFAIAVSTLVLAAIGFVTWRSFYYLSKPSSSVAAASRAMVQTPPASPAPAPMSIVPATQPAVMSEPPAATEQAPVADQRQATQPRMTAPPATQSEPATPPPGATKARPETVAQPPAATKLAPVAQPAPAAEPAPVYRQSPKRGAGDEAVRGRHAALRGYVWSPEKHTLVPAEPAAEDDALPRHVPMRGYTWSPEKHTLVPAKPAAEDPLPREDPGTRSLDGAPAAEPQPQLAPTTPAPFRPEPSPSPPPSESAPIIE